MDFSFRLVNLRLSGQALQVNYQRFILDTKFIECGSHKAKIRETQISWVISITSTTSINLRSSGNDVVSQDQVFHSVTFVTCLSAGGTTSSDHPLIVTNEFRLSHLPKESNRLSRSGCFRLPLVVLSADAGRISKSIRSDLYRPITFKPVSSLLPVFLKPKRVLPLGLAE